jgi:hypothetical protein
MTASRYPLLPRSVLGALAVFVAGLAPAVADPPAPGDGDLLDQARRREQVAAQKVEADFRTALIELHKLAATDPARAAERCKKVLAVLEEDTVLSEHKREAWKRMLKDRIRVLEAEAAGAARDEAAKADRTIRAEERRGADDRKAREQAQLRDDLDRARQLQKEGRGDEAQRLADDVARRHPTSPAADASRRITGMSNRVAELNDLKRERERRDSAAFKDVLTSAMPPIGDIEFPSPEKWRDITKRRTKSSMTEAEKAIMEALEKPITVNLKGSTFEAAIDYLQTLIGQPINVDKATLEAAGVDYTTPVTAKVRNVSVRTLLRKVLGEVGLTYIVKGEAIQVVTPQEARDIMTVRAYYLGDLAGAADFQFGPAFNQLQMRDTVNALIQQIVGTIEPDSWAVNNNGGKGTIVFDPRTLSLIVKQSAEVHYMLGGAGR